MTGHFIVQVPLKSFLLLRETRLLEFWFSQWEQHSQSTDLHWFVFYQVENQRKQEGQHSGVPPPDWEPPQHFSLLPFQLWHLHLPPRAPWGAAGCFLFLGKSWKPTRFILGFCSLPLLSTSSFWINQEVISLGLNLYNIIMITIKIIIIIVIVGDDDDNGDIYNLCFVPKEKLVHPTAQAISRGGTT